MRVAIYQPQYFPRLHYFNRMLNSDIFVILDSAQYTKSLVHEGNTRSRHKSYQSDTPIKTASGVYDLTVPVMHNGLSSMNKTGIMDSNKWRMKHCLTIKSGYGKAEEADLQMPGLREIIETKYKSLAELNTASMLWALGILLALDKRDMKSVNNSLKKNSAVRLKQILVCSELGVVRPKGKQKGTEWTLEICRKLGASEYYHGGTANAGYMDVSLYNREKIRPIVQEWICQEYRQRFSEKQGFLKNLSIIDLLLNEPRERALAILS